MSEATDGPSTAQHPSAGFADNTKPGLIKAAFGVNDMNSAAKSGDLVLDEETGRRVLQAIDQVKQKVDAMVKDASNLDEPLRLGNNYVAGLLDRRLRDAAAGKLDDEGAGAALPVLRNFQRVINTYERAVRKAMRDQQNADEDVSEEFVKMAGGLPEQGEQR